MGDGNGNGKIQTIIAASAIATVLLGGFGGVIWFGRLDNRVAVLEDTSTRRDAEVVILRDRIETLRTEVVKLGEAKVEIETQFRAADQIRNQMHLHDLRMIAMLVEKVYGQRYPTDASDFPTIAK